MKIDLVVLDMAGTTVHDGDAVHAAIEGALRAHGALVTRDQVNEVMGMPKPVALELLLERATGGPPDPARVEEIYGDFERRMVSFYRHDPSVREIFPASDVFRELRRHGIRVALDTGFARAIVDAILERLGWNEDLLDATVSSDEVERGRPHPDLILRAMELAGVSDASRVAKVGDTPADLAEGRAARCRLLIGVTEGSHRAEELAPHPHTHLIGSVAELPSLLARVGAIERRDPLLFTPGPLTTSRTVKEAMLRDVGSRDSDFVNLVSRLRRGLLSVAGLEPGDGYEAVLVQGSGTFAIEGVLSSFVPRDGNLLVLSNGAYGERILEIGERLGVSVDALRFEEHEVVDPEAVRRRMAGESFTHAAIVHCETTSGILNPVQAVGEAVHEQRAAYIVDAMSSFGALPLDLEAARVDFLVSSANKCLEGVPGIAFALVRRGALDMPDAFGRSLSLDLVAQWRCLESNGQFRFTPPTHVLLALERALAELSLEGGVEGRARRYRANHAVLLEGMHRLGFKPCLSPEHQSPIITSFEYPAYPWFRFEDFYDRLRTRGMILYPGKIGRAPSFRIGTIGRIYPSDVRAVLEAIEKVLVEMESERS